MLKVQQVLKALLVVQVLLVLLEDLALQVHPVQLVLPAQVEHKVPKVLKVQLVPPVQ